MTNYLKTHPAYVYAKAAVKDKRVPKYVKKQCADFTSICDGKSEKYFIDETKAKLIDNLLRIMIMPTGLKVGQTIYAATTGYQFLFYTATLCVVYREDPLRRRYETSILEICRKNFKTFTVAIVFILLFFTEERFSKFFSVAPDGALSREVQSAIKEIIKVSPYLGGNDELGIKSKFKILRDKITCTLNESSFTPLNYSTSRLDGRLPTVFLADEVGALPSAYAIEAMRSGQITIKNKLGCIISTKYPKFDNVFEDEVRIAKMILDGLINNDTYFSLLYEPDNPSKWITDDNVLYQANPVAIQLPEVFENLKQKREMAILTPSKRENFLTKHCNIIYQGASEESFIDVADVQKCAVDEIDLSGKTVYVGLDLSITTDNTAVAITYYDSETNKIGCVPMAFIPADRIDDKCKIERIDYREFINDGDCIPCGDRVIDYSVVENYVMQIEEKFGCTVHSVGYDRYNALSTAQKLMNANLVAVEVIQHSKILHSPTKLLEEYILKQNFMYKKNKLYEINFQNAKCLYDTNLNKYINKKRSTGKVDMVAATINALYLLEQNELLNEACDWAVQV